MDLRPEEVAKRLRDTKVEREVADALRAMADDAQRFAFIKALVPLHHIVALRLANACLREACYFEEVLAIGLNTANASDIRHWLEAVVPRLGLRRVVALVAQRIDDPPVVEKAAYFLPGLLPTGGGAARDAEALDRLFQEGRRRGLRIPDWHPAGPAPGTPPP